MFSKEEIAVILEVDPSYLKELLQDKSSPIFRNFYSARLKREALIRQGIFELAENGSSPAQTFAMKLIENAKANDL